MKIIKQPVKKSELLTIANEEFGDIVKAVVDIEQEIMAIGGELHSDEEVFLTEKENSKRENTWGINLYPKKSDKKFIEFDSMINIKPHYDNCSRNVENSAIKEKIKKIVQKLIRPTD